MRAGWLNAEGGRGKKKEGHTFLAMGAETKEKRPGRNLLVTEGGTVGVRCR